MADKKEPAPLTAADVQKLIDDALTKYSPDTKAIVIAATEQIAEGLPVMIVKVVDEQLLKLELPTSEQLLGSIAGALGIDLPLEPEKFAAFIAANVDFGALVDCAIDNREARQAEAAAAQEKAAVAEKEASTARLVKADKAAAAKLEKQVRADAAEAAKRVDRAARDYKALVDTPVVSGLTVATGQVITLRLADGASFHPEHDLTLGTDDLQEEVGRLINSKVINLPADFSPFTASEAILIVEGGKGPAALYRSAIESPLRFGGGAAAQLAIGALAFRRLSPEPEAAEAA